MKTPWLKQCADKWLELDRQKQTCTILTSERSILDLWDELRNSPSEEDRACFTIKNDRVTGLTMIINKFGCTFELIEIKQPASS